MHSITTMHMQGTETAIFYFYFNLFDFSECLNDWVLLYEFVWLNSCTLKTQVDFYSGYFKVEIETSCV